MGKVDDALEYAKVAQQMAASAMVSLRAQGIIFESLITVLRDSGILPKDALRRVFLVSAAVIDDAKPTTELERNSVRAAREIVVNIAAGFDVKVPPPGQTGIQRKH